MGQEDDVHAAIAHVVLSCVAARGTTHRYNSYAHPGTHVNLFVHGVIGFLHYQSGKFNNDFSPAYVFSYKASRYLPLPCLMADLYRGNSAMCSLHLASGILPFALAITQQDNPELGNLLIACNIVSLCYYSFEHGNVWGWYTAGPRSVGRPPARWTDDLVKVAGASWMRVAQDRSSWRSLGEAYAQQGECFRHTPCLGEGTVVMWDSLPEWEHTHSHNVGRHGIVLIYHRDAPLTNPRIGLLNAPPMRRCTRRRSSETTPWNAEGGKRSAGTPRCSTTPMHISNTRGTADALPAFEVVIGSLLEGP
ncbi:hypothetical protein RR46_04028 [Papilio xuthus]|uniref:Uncharacterized protein n=1 Tax=Papilio xuthus TaxID=66420 RepID=A0A194QNY2_PAPXU|nr:hypothetical protein RR46_04028 [Papilio xuthus]